jgi:hypothetical protein
MKKLLVILFLLMSGTSTAQLFKYSTFYLSGTATSPMAEQPRYMMDRSTGQLTDITTINPYNYKVSFGLRKIARFDYENKANVFYDGSENPISNSATIGAVSGSEYLLACDLVRNRGNEFINHEYWYRHVSKYWMIKGTYVDKQEINLKHFGADIRGKIDLGKFNLSAGVKHRSHPVYGLNPFTENFNLAVDPWWSVAYDLGYEDDYWYFDGEGNGVDDPYDYYNWNWFAPDGTLVATTDEEFMKYEFGKAVDHYNRTYLNNLGLQQELSIVVGLSYYYYRPKYWIHFWGDIMPKHKGLSDYSYDENNIDFDIGTVLGFKMSKRFGLFLEGRYQKYWDINNYEIKTGINYTIF